MQWYIPLQVYASEVGFDGTPNAFLRYNYLDPVMPPNSPIDFDQSTENSRIIISFSFYSQKTEGIILILQNNVRLS